MKIEFKRKTSKRGERSVYLYCGGSAVTCYSHPSVHEPATDAEKATKAELKRWLEEEPWE